MCISGRLRCRQRDETKEKGGRAGVRLINLEKRNDQIGSVCKVMTESLEDEIPAEEAEGTIVSDPNADAPDIDDAADVNENESNNEIEE